jgi:hypothetical protein
MRKKILNLLIILVILSDVTCQRDFEAQNKPKLRSFSIGALKKLRDLRRAYEIKRKFLDEVEKKELEIRDKQLLEEDKERQMYFEQYLAPRHHGTSFLRDFHTSRFF